MEWDHDRFRNVIFSYFLLCLARWGFWKLKGRGVVGSLADLYRGAMRTAYGYILRTPGDHGKIQRQVQESLAKMSTKLAAHNLPRHVKLPEQALSAEIVLGELDGLAKMDHTRWEEGYVSGAVYHGEDALLQLQTQAYGKFTVSNPLHPDVFPGVRKMEAEIVTMVLNMFDAPSDAVGVTTAGGTESILMACLSARRRGHAERGITAPEMIIPSSAHAAFRKAGDYFNIMVHTVACPGPSFQVDVRAMSRLINSNTVLLAGSAPNFPHGVIDDIEAISRLAVRKNLCLHVDCCLGSFLMPYLGKAGFKTQLFDFNLHGVTSISCDTHKYGFAPKGNSTLLYRSAKLRTYQYYVCPDWSGGVYASPSIAGSRPGALIAGCWATLMSVGQDGYLDSCVRIVGTAKSIESAIRTGPVLSSELEILGEPLVSVVAFSARNLNIYDIADNMAAKGWHLNALQDPPAINIAVTVPVSKVWERLITDLEQTINEERDKEKKRLESGETAKGKAAGDAAALYGTAGSLPNKGVVVDLATGFLDLLYQA
ncbi:pyridoxal phosphate-dependent transferase [Aspergillus pseudoustus]|uniref:sphinganine-1-phosphate aldolase n=1 Tax=Aspergillus pseudoustus TaxID=1810923 RepID=A0ABR4JGT9_9EURO